MATIRDSVLVGNASTALPVVSTAEAKLHLRIDHDDEDTLIGDLVAAATEVVEVRSRRQLAGTTRRVELDGFPPLERGDLDTRIILPRPPLISITHVKYLDAAGVDTTLDAAEYSLVLGYGGSEGGRGWVQPAYGKSWPTHRVHPGSVRITYVCGYGGATPEAGDVPQALRRAILLLVGHWYANREAVIVGTNASELPMAVASLIAAHACPESV